MTHSTNDLSRIITMRSPRLAGHGARLGRSAVALSALCIAALAAVACSSDGAQRTSDGAGTKEKNFNPFATAGSDAEGAGASADAAKGGTVQLGQPFLSGTCTQNATASIVADSQRYVTVVFSNQQYGGDRNSPDYWKERTEGRLIGDAKSTAPKCVLHVPMKVTAGYRFSPTNIVVHGFAHRGFVFGAYQWANTSGGYTFERQVPLNEPADSGGDDFVYTEPLHNLWSPTCSKTGGATVDAELVVTLQPYTATGTDNTIVAIDAFDVAGFGSLEQCGNPTSYDRVAQEGEDCGIVEMDYVHPVRCDTSKQTNICVYYPTNANTGTCVNASRRPAASELVVGYDGDCGGPFYKYCGGNDGPLVCQFSSGDARQNASSHYGRCVRPLAVGDECKKELYGACNGNTCNTTVDPCESGATCTNGKCVAKKGNGASPQAEDEPASGAEPTSDDEWSNGASPSSANDGDDSGDDTSW